MPLAWELYAIIMNKGFLYPRLSEIFSNIIAIIGSARFYTNLSVSLGRALLALFFSLLLALTLSIFRRCHKYIDSLVLPYQLAFSSFPPMVMVVVFMILYDKSTIPYLLSSLVLVPVLTETITHRIDSTDRNLLRMCQLFQVGRAKKIRNVYFPHVMRGIISILFAMFANSFKFVLAGEVFANPSKGIGSELNLLRANFQISMLFAWVVIIAVISTILYGLQKLIFRKALAEEL